MRAEPMTFFFFYIRVNLSCQPIGFYTSGMSHPNPRLPQPLPKTLVVILYKTWYDDQAA